MAKLSLVAASFALLFLVTTASVIITTVEIEEATSHHERGCQEEVKRQSLRNCEQFLTECSRSPRMMARGERCQEQMQECCQEVKEMDEECRCQGIKKMMQRQQGQIGRQQMERMAEKAMELPRMCGVSSGRCEIRTVWY